MNRKFVAGLSLSFVILIVLVSLCICAGFAWFYFGGKEKLTGPSEAKATLQAKAWATQTAIAATAKPVAPSLTVPPADALTATHAETLPSPTPTPEQPQKAISEIPPELKDACLALFFLRWQTQEIISLAERAKEEQIPEEEAKKEAQAALARLNTAEADLINLAPAAGLEEAKTKAQEGLDRVKTALTKWLDGSFPITATVVELKRRLGPVEEASKMAEDRLENEYGVSADDLENLLSEAKDKYS
ncbi:MAG: hypothetical protein ACUVV0_09765 [Anaerolineae bacterium]